jgi:hypothetical protein
MEASEVIEIARAEIRNQQTKAKDKLVRQAVIEVDRCNAELKRATARLEEVANMDITTISVAIENDYWVTSTGCYTVPAVK